MSYTLNYTGSEIDDILDRAAPGGALDTAIATKQDALTFDAVPTEGSTNPAESGGIYDAIQAGGAAALGAYPTDSVSGDVVSFPDGADGIPVKAFEGSIIPSQSGSGDPAPDNVRPISGWTGANITRAGVNLWDEQWEVGDYDSATGEKIARNNTIRCKNRIPVLPSTKYYAVIPVGSAPLFFYDEDGNYITPAASAVNGEFTTPANAHYMAFRLGSNYGTTYKHDISINYPSTVTTYQPYNGSTIVLNFGQTVYAGTLTALGGGKWKIQPTHAAVDMGSAEWTYDATYTRFKTTVSAANYGNRLMPIYCSIYQCIDDGRALANVPDYSIYNGSSTSIYIKDTRYTDPAAIALALSGQYMVYPLGTLPDPIIVSVEDLQTLLGANTVWTDVGSVTGMTYRADTALYIQKLLNGGTLQTLSMASPSPSLSLGRVGVLAEQEEAEPEQAEEEAEQLEQTEESEQTEEA